VRVGICAPNVNMIGIEGLGVLDWIVAHKLEGLEFSSHQLLKWDEETRSRFLGQVADNGLYLELSGGGINPGNSGKSVDDLVAAWKPLFPLAQRAGAGILNTCLGQFQIRTLPSPSLAEQIEMTIQVLRRIAPMAADHDITITVELHLDLWSKELLGLIQAVDSPYVAVNLDTANSVGLLEDPVQAARNLMPYVRATHYKDKFVYLTEGGYFWQGAPLGTGLVDLSTITEMLYAHNPEVNLTIEDAGPGGYTIPLYDADFINSFPGITAMDIVGFLEHLRKGAHLLHIGQHPRQEDLQGADRKSILASWLWRDAEYARHMRDQVVARHAAQGKAG
jgi:sugar phosphate isomerase/epimerase